MLLLLKKIDIHVVLMFKSVHCTLANEDVFLYTAGLGRRFCRNFFFVEILYFTVYTQVIIFLKEIHHTFEMPYFIFVLIMAFTASIMFLNNNTFITTVFVNINSVMLLLKILSMKYFLMFSSFCKVKIL